jgi:hypothetical protein
MSRVCRLRQVMVKLHVVQAGSRYVCCLQYARVFGTEQGAIIEGKRSKMRVVR